MTSASSRWRSGLARVLAAPAWPWCLAFTIMCVTAWYDGGMNAASRFAMTRAMSARQTLRINRYVDWYWTCDWARTPDGAYYSNKAPGPALLAFPATWAMDQALFAWDPELKRTQPSVGYKTAVSVLYHVLPCVLVVLLASQMLCRRGVSPMAQWFAALAILFGNTASVYMNSFYGHGMTAWLLLALALALLADRPALAGCFFGFALLCDYAVGLLALPFLLGFFVRRESWRSRGQRALYLVAGAAVPAALWVWYHTVCFGNPFTTGLSYQNPVFRYKNAASDGLQTVWAFRPRWAVLRKLLVGPSQGLLFTQPWVLVTYLVSAALLLRRRLARVPASLTILLLVGLPLLIWSNTGYKGWNGGWIVGPRYPSALFPLIGLYAALFYDRLSAWLRALLWLTLIPAVVLRILIYAGPSPYLPAERPVWSFFWGYMVSDPLAEARLRTLALVSVLLLAAWQAHRLSRPDDAQETAGACVDGHEPLA
jgi:hypothetical protein